MTAWYKRGKMHFDDGAWKLVTAHARKTHKTIQQIVIAALKRGFKRYAQKTKDIRSETSISNQADLEPIKRTKSRNQISSK